MRSEEDQRLEALRLALSRSEPKKVKYPTVAMPESGFKRKKVTGAAPKYPN